MEKWGSDQKAENSTWTEAMRVLTAIFLFWGPFLAANTLPSEKRKNGPLIQEALAPVQVYLQESSAVFYDNETYKNFIYGTVVSADGLILTKASELDQVSDYVVRIGTKKYRDVKVLATDAQWDVSLVAVDAEGLKPVDLKGESEVELGTWVVANGASERRFRRPRPGIVSAKRREIPGGTPAVLGIRFKMEDQKLLVLEVTKDSGAQKAGVKKGDLITSVDTMTIESEQSLVEYLRNKAPGDELKIGIEREGKPLELTVALVARHELYGGPQNRNDQMSGEFSARRTSFPMVLQHEVMLSARSVGGPLFTLEGKFLGMNIAAANRVESYAIPVENLSELFQRLKDKASIK